MTGGGPWRMPDQLCLACGKHVTSVSSLFDNVRPDPGDFTMCLDCGNLMAFDHDLKLRALTVIEAIEAANDPRIAQMQWARRQTERH